MSTTSLKSFIKLPLLFSDNALFLHGVPFRVWGKTEKSCKSISVCVSKENKVFSSAILTVKNGVFDGVLPAVPAGLNYMLTSACGEKTHTINNVAFGEVFLAGGQSNMGWRMFQCYNKDMSLLYQKEIDTSFNPAIRMYGVLRKYSDHRTREVQASFSNGWQEANPQSVADFGAIAYFFAQRMWELCKIPVGVVMSCMGGTPIHTWIPKEEYEELLQEGFDRIEAQSPDRRPSSYFNGCIYPLRKFAFSGVLWYQGCGDYNRYAERYAKLIKGWRKLFQKELPFVDCGIHSMEKEWREYALCRIDHKRATTLVASTAYTTIVDTGLPIARIGETDSLNPDTGIHPYDKKTVGFRTAERYFGAFMGGTDLCDAPTLRSVTKANGGLLLTFKNVGEGIALKGKAGFYAVTADGAEQRLLPTLVANDAIYLPISISEPFELEYAFRFETELGEKPQEMADAVSVYNTKNGELAYPLDSFRIKIS
ncbi:MAG: hypothetical protein IIY09_00340 [Clostridia bacterium]|nr:hypothetical protein [Clostridia bacterium]